MGSVVRRAAGRQDDPGPRPGGAPVLGVDHPPVEAEGHAPEGVDQVGESLQVDGGVVLDRNAQVEPDRSLQRAEAARLRVGRQVGAPAHRVGLGIGRKLVDLVGVDAIAVDGPIRKRHEAGVARHRDHDRGPGHRVDAHHQDRVGERLLAPHPRVDAEEKEADPRRPVPSIGGMVDGPAPGRPGRCRMLADEDVAEGRIDPGNEGSGPGVHRDRGHQQDDDEPDPDPAVRRACAAQGWASGERRPADGRKAPGHQREVDDHCGAQEARREELVAEPTDPAQPRHHEERHEQQHRRREEDRHPACARICLPEAGKEEREEGCQAGVAGRRAIRDGHLEAISCGVAERHGSKNAP